MNELAGKLRHARICNGDWARVVTNGALSHGTVVGIFLDPPYDLSMRNKDLYNHDQEGLAKDVRDWCIANGDNKRYRIALCGYEGEHNELVDLGWSVYRWKAGSAYQRNSANGKNLENRVLERIWFSPGCVTRNNMELQF
jgi:hypothetical protein